MRKDNNRYKTLRALLLRFILGFVGVAVLGACSTTKHLPEDEQLYVGIDEIAYNGYKHGSAEKKPEGGVIQSIATAAAKVEEVLEGKRNSATTDSVTQSALISPTKSDRKAQKAALSLAKKEWEETQAEVEAVLSYAPNHALLGSNSVRSPFRFGLWLYNAYANDTTKFGRWMFRNFATTPVFISSVSPDVRAKVATNTLRNYGYFNGKVEYDVRTQKNPRTAKIAYNIIPNELWRYGHINYRHFPTLQDSLVRASLPQAIIKEGHAFSAITLEKERTRLSNLFREHGYYFHAPTFVTLQADTFERKGWVDMRVQPAPQIPSWANRPWAVGKTYVNISRFAGDSLTTHLERRNLSLSFGGKRPPLRPYMWRHALFFRRGDRYSLAREKLSLEKLNDIGVFSHLDMSFIPRDTTATADTLDVYINATIDKLYTASLELNAKIKSSQQAGPGLSFELAKLNAFNGGERVAFKIYGSHEWQTGAGAEGGNSLLNSYELGTQLSFEIPRFLLPFVSRRRLRFPATTTFALNGNWRNRANFYQMVTGGLSANYKWYKKRTLTHSLTLFNMEYNKLLSTTEAFDYIMDENPVLYISMRDQYIPSMSYTLTYSSAATHRNPIWAQLMVKEAGLLTNSIYKMAGRSWGEKSKRLLGTPFSQFVKITGEVHHQVNIRNLFTLASRLFAGAMFTYGNSDFAPYAEQFYVGGANSVRAFTVRSVGPGNYKSASSKYAYLDQTGDVKVEANVEARFPIMGSLHGAVFLDAGNVWTVRTETAGENAKFAFSKLKNVAVGTGLGLRYDLSFLVLRFDLGVALHAPYETGKRGWYNIAKFSDGLAFHFAIGYPF